MNSWKRLGQIFKTDTFATSPRALIFEDSVRIYYSYRVPDKDKVLSKIAFVDFTKDFKKIIGRSTKQVISLGKPGCFDEHGIKPFVPFRHKAKEIFGFIGGISRKDSACVDSAIGLAISKDNGETFKRMGQGPLIGANLNEPFLIADPFLIEKENRLHLFYIFGSKWSRRLKEEPYARFYQITHATSFDGLNWLRTGKYIIEPETSDECQSTPTIVQIKDLYYCYFCYRRMFDFKERENSYRIGLATSKDLFNWERQEDDFLISESGWDSEMICYPHVFEMDDNFYMIYNGNGFGKYGFGLAVMEQ